MWSGLISATRSVHSLYSKHFQASSAALLSSLQMKRSLTVQPSLDQFFKKYAPPPAKPAAPKVAPAPSPPSPKTLVRSISTRNPAPERAQETAQKKVKLEQIITDLSEPPEVSGDIIKQSSKTNKPSVTFSVDAKESEVIMHKLLLSSFSLAFLGFDQLINRSE